jgi:hypothetical protein
MDIEAAIAQAVRLLAGAPGAQLAGLSDEASCRYAAEVERLGRIVDALRLRAAADLGARSRRVPERAASTTLPRRLGVVSDAQVLERVARISQSEAGRRIRLGEQVSAGTTLLGEVIPAAFPVVAAAVTTGEIGVDAVAAIVRPLADAARRADPDQVAAAERHLVDEARAGLPDLLRVQARVLCQALDPDGARPREEELRRRRAFRIGREVGGMTPFHGMADPVGAALLRAAIADRTAPSRTPRFVDDDDPAVERDDGGVPVRDERRRDQRAYDVLIGLLTAGVRCDRAGTAPLHATATVQVVVTAADLERGTGLAWLDDVAEPIAAATAAEIACDGGMTPTLVDDRGRPLRQGRRLRCFTAAQRQALVARDGNGCPMPQCTAPPSWTHAHHVTEWRDGGATDIDNGVLLCAYHHRLVHDRDFRLRMIEGLPHLLAPPWIDPEQQWRPIGRPRWRAARPQVA